MPSQLPSRLTRNTLWLTIGQATRIAIQATYFLLIARTLHVANYGAFTGVVAFVAMVAPFASLGSGTLIVRRVALDPQAFRTSWGNALLLTVMSATALLCGVECAAHFLIPRGITMQLVTTIAVADLYAVRVVDIACQAFQSVERGRSMVFLYILLSGTRLIAIASARFFLTSPTATQWGTFYCVSSILPAIVACLAVGKTLGSPKLDLNTLRSGLAEGAQYAIGLSSQTIYNDLDKTMLLRWSTLFATGIYSAAYRLIDVAFIPVNATLAAAFSGMFRAGSSGLKSSLTYSRPLLYRASLYAAVATIILILSSRSAAHLLGPQYSDVAVAIRWLAILPIFKSIHYFCSDMLTGAGYQWLRTVVQGSTAIINVCLNLWLLPTYSWRGAAWTSIISDAFLAFVVAAAVRLVLAHERRVKQKHLSGSSSIAITCD